MDNVSITLYICMIVPFLMIIPLLTKRGRWIMLFIVIGLTVCLLSAGVNRLFYQLLGSDAYYISTTVSPVVEELLKALPVLIFAFFITDSREELLSVSFSLGVGFALLENTILFSSSSDSLNYFWALARGFGAGLMHSICTMVMGMGFSFVKKNRRLFFSGTFALLSGAITYHAIFNMLVQSPITYLGLLIPILTYIPVIFRIRSMRVEGIRDV